MIGLEKYLKRFLIIKSIDDNNLITISQYYVRDNRLFECYILFQILCTLNPFDIKMNRTEKEIQILRQIE